MLLAHISDLHLSRGILSGSAAERAYEAFARIQALDPQPDCVVITGDLTEHGTTAEYDDALSLLSMFDIPIHIVPGNHDHASRLLTSALGRRYARSAADEPDRCYYSVDYPDVRLLCCDSSVVGRHDGELGAVQLSWLAEELARDPQLPKVLTMHHHPVPSGIGAMDPFMLSDAQALSEVLKRHQPLVRILTGHLHRTLISTLAGSVVITAPSTFQQVFLDLSPRHVSAYVDEPASILLHRIDDGQATSHVVSVRSGPPLGVIGGSSPRAVL